jgi:N-acetylmuramoyl-L-alanine amidase
VNRLLFALTGIAARMAWSLAIWAVMTAAMASAQTSNPPAAVTATILNPAATPTPPQAVRATAVAFSGDQQRTRAIFTVTGPIKPSAFVLNDPVRVIVDVPDLQFKFAASEIPSAHGLITAWRYGLFATRKSRIVLDVAGPVKIEQARVIGGQNDQPWQLVISLIATDPTTFEALVKAHSSASPAALKASVTEDLPAVSASPKARPVVLIDPGHGGLDPGTVAGKVYEKAVVLAVARHLRAKLLATGRYDVAMTRSTDVFISLDQRLRASERLRADLFISIHADSVGDSSLAQNVRGATVYTLSEQASDEQARLLAEKENAVDLLAGLEQRTGPAQDQVRNILVDLMKRETSNFSHEFSEQLLGELRQYVALARDPQRSAAFKVLKQTQTPSVLIELGYMSNGQDQKLLQSSEWQGRVGDSIAAAVDAFFAKRATTAAR